MPAAPRSSPGRGRRRGRRHSCRDGPVGRLRGAGSPWPCPRRRGPRTIDLDLRSFRRRPPGPRPPGGASTVSGGSTVADRRDDADREPCEGIRAVPGAVLEDDRRDPRVRIGPSSGGVADHPTGVADEPPLAKGPRVDPEAIAFGAARGDGCRHPGERGLRNDRRAIVGRALAKEHPRERGHIGAVRGDRAVRGPRFEPRRRGQRRPRVPDPVVRGRFVADGQSWAHGIGDGRFARCHPHRTKETALDHGRVWLAFDRLDDEPECLVPHVRVVEASARNRTWRQIAQSPDLECRFGCAIDAGRDPRGVAQEVSDRDARPGARDAKPREVSFDRVVECDATLGLELHDHEGREGLADRPDLEQRVGRDRSPAADLGESVRSLQEGSVAIGDGDGETRQGPVVAHPPDDGIDDLARWIEPG